MMNGLIASALLLFLLLGPARVVHAQWVQTDDPKAAAPAITREFRGAWVATVANIDWPSSRTLTPAQQHAEMLRILDAARGMNLNAVLLQVRPACDAIYPSNLEPWSEFLTGQSGEKPKGAAADYDPLREWITEAHARGIELHAWFNPFRARHFDSKQPDAATHISRTRPDLVRSYDQFLWMDPGEPDAKTHTLMVVADVVSRYDIDGVHFDDYFYPYPKDKVPFPDDSGYLRYRAAAGPGAMNKSDWRRANINGFVKAAYEQIKKVKPHVKVGISPFGIYRPGMPPGVQGFDQFEGLSADARLWLREGWVDYVTPQLYWKIAAPQQPYQRLLQWWVDQNDRGRHVWPGNFTSRILAADVKPDAKGKIPESWENSEIVQQIELTRSELPRDVAGNVHFSMVALVENRRGVADALRNGPYAASALVPASRWLAGDAPLPGKAAVTVTAAADGVNVAWRPESGGAYRAVVRARYGETWSMLDPGEPADSRVLDAKKGSAELAAVSVVLIDRVGREGPGVVVVRR